ncbi:MAG: ABC transporter permease [Bacteroidia bacterium]|nr:ABC transporter permease [Bacteroidia bacterium]
MNFLRLSWHQIAYRPLTALLSLLLMALGAGLISLLLLVRTQLDEQFTRNLNGIDLVIGAKGSPLQLILASVYHIDQPTGNIPLRTADSIARHPLVERAVPLSYGDSYRGYRIVGTDSGFAAMYQLRMAEGRSWAAPFEAVAGAAAARRLHLAPGDTFYSTHGLAGAGEAHEAHAYRITGILEPAGTAADQLILTSLESIWDAHAHEAEDPAGGHEEAPRDITAMLLKFRNPMGLFAIPRGVNAVPGLQAALPAVEVSRLTQQLFPFAKGLQGLAVLIMLTSAVSVLISLYDRLRERRYELALMRVMGAAPWKLAVLLLTEALILALTGAAAGLALSRLGLLALNTWAADTYHYTFRVWTLAAGEAWLLGGAVLLGVLAGLLPGFLAARLDLSRTLADG